MEQQTTVLTQLAQLCEIQAGLIERQSQRLDSYEQLLAKAQSIMDRQSAQIGLCMATLEFIRTCVQQNTGGICHAPAES